MVEQGAVNSQAVGSSPPSSATLINEEFILKNKTMKREEALARARKYTWEDSKAKRLDKSTQAEWEAKQVR